MKEQKVNKDDENMASAAKAINHCLSLTLYFLTAKGPTLVIVVIIFTLEVYVVIAVLTFALK